MTLDLAADGAGVIETLVAEHTTRQPSQLKRCLYVNGARLGTGVNPVVFTDCM